MHSKDNIKIKFEKIEELKYLGKFILGSLIFFAVMVILPMILIIIFNCICFLATGKHFIEDTTNAYIGLFIVEALFVLVIRFLILNLEEEK